MQLETIQLLIDNALADGVLSPAESEVIKNAIY